MSAPDKPRVCKMDAQMGSPALSVGTLLEAALAWAAAALAFGGKRELDG